MARTTASHGWAAGNDRCAHCNTKAEATVSGPNARTGEPVTLRCCLSCVTRYLPTGTTLRPGQVIPTVTPDPEANVALCACNRFIGHAGRAAHKCAAVA